MDIKAFKMDGLGNDFVIIDNRKEITNLTKEQIIKICDRNFIGCRSFRKNFKFAVSLETKRSTLVSEGSPTSAITAVCTKYV